MNGFAKDCFALDDPTAEVDGEVFLVDQVVRPEQGDKLAGGAARTQSLIPVIHRMFGMLSDLNRSRELDELAGEPTPLTVSVELPRLWRWADA